MKTTPNAKVLTATCLSVLAVTCPALAAGTVYMDDDPLCEVVVAGDINGDCRVDFLDFRLMALHWLDDNSP